MNGRASFFFSKRDLPSQRKTTATANTTALQTTAKSKSPMASSASMRRGCS
jgi:hypothetical protein